MLTLIKNIGLLETPIGRAAARGKKQGETVVYRSAAVLCDGGTIAEITADGKLPDAKPDRVFDAGGRLVTPGLVDCHTHMAFGGWRAHELSKKLGGAGYLDILREGGGILDTVRETRRLSERELADRTAGFLRESFSYGATTVEIKSGYGLDLENELKQLRAIKAAEKNAPTGVVATYMGAHAIPPEFDEQSYADFICDTVLPAARPFAEFCDVFCESGVFGVRTSERILLAAKKLGFALKIHADEINALGGSPLAAKLAAASAEHLIAIDGDGISALANSDTVAVLLPLTSFYLGKPFAPARRMVESGIPVAVATDFNPGSCPCLNIQLAISAACTGLRLSPPEALNAVTLNAAAALNRADSIGSVEVGKQADFAVWNADKFEMLCYRLGSNLLHKAIKNGEVL